MKIKHKFKLGFFTVFLCAMIWLSSFDYFVALILSVTIHECGHLVMARLCHIPIRQLKLGILGAALTPSELLYSYKKEILLCLGGPIFNFLSMLIFFPLCRTSHILGYFFMSSFALGTLNLLPIIGFDGGRVLSAILNMVLSPYASKKIMSIISFIFIFTLWCISVYLLLKISASLSMFIFSVSIFCKIFLPEEI